MSELSIKLEEIHPVELLGVNNAKLKIMQKEFPALAIHARGNEIRVQGDIAQIENFNDKLRRMINYILRHNQLSENRLIEILKTDEDQKQNLETGVILHGNSGKIIRTKTQNQQYLFDASSRSDVVFAIGPAGTGKTYTSVAIAVRALKNKEVKRIILTRPAVEAGESLGFLPGDIREKVDPYLQPLYDALYDMIPPEKLRFYMENKTIEVAPLAFMRGRTLDNAFVILDEAQNATISQLKMFLTRMGPNAKFIVNGDLTQIDLPVKSQSGLVKAIEYLNDIPGVEIIHLTVKDVTRHKIVKHIITAFDRMDEARKKENKRSPNS